MQREGGRRTLSLIFFRIVWSPILAALLTAKYDYCCHGRETTREEILD